MAAKKTKRREKKGASRKKVAVLEKRAAKRLAVGPMERADEGIVAAARRLWLEADSLRTARGASTRKPGRKGKAKLSR